MPVCTWGVPTRRTWVWPGVVQVPRDEVELALRELAILFVPDRMHDTMATIIGMGCKHAGMATDHQHRVARAHAQAGHEVPRSMRTACRRRWTRRTGMLTGVLSKELPYACDSAVGYPQHAALHAHEGSALLVPSRT